MNIIEIYDQYKINQGLREHMIRVAAVAKQAADNYTFPVDSQSVVSACLLHDMGNILKITFDLGHDDHFAPEGIEYWREVKNEFRNRYGDDVHEATLAIIKDIKPPESVFEIVSTAQFEEISRIADQGTIEAKFLEYADMRVGLRGIVSLGERFDDIEARYTSRFTSEEFQALRQAATQIETEIFSQCPITPNDITDASTADIQTELLDWRIPRL